MLKICFFKVFFNYSSSVEFNYNEKNRTVPFLIFTICHIFIPMYLNVMKFFKIIYCKLISDSQIQERNGSIIDF